MKPIFLLAVVMLAGCASTGPGHPRSIHHIVFIDLNDANQAAELTTDCGELARIPGVADLEAGRPIPGGRANVDSAYDVGLYVRFTAASDYQTYIDHPIHTGLVSKWRPRWKSILIRDFGPSP